MSPRKRLVTGVGVASSATFTLLFLWTGVLAGFSAAYNITVGTSSGLAKDLRGGTTAKAVAATLGAVAWLAIPLAIGTLVSLLVAWWLEVIPLQLTDDDKRKKLDELLNRPSAADSAAPSSSLDGAQ